MAIKKFFTKKAKAGWRWDAEKAQFFSWGFDIRKADGKRKRENGFATRHQAEAAVGRLRLGEKNRKYELIQRNPFPMLRELADKRIANLTDRPEAVRSQRVLSTLIECLDNPRLDELTTPIINRYTEIRQNDGVSDATINRELRLIRATLNQALSFFDDLEDWTPPKVRYLKVPRTRRERLVQSGEGQKILFYLLRPRSDLESERIFFSRRRAGLLFLLAAVTGARPTELLRLTDDDVLHDIGKLKITGRKTRFKTAKTVRYFPLVPIVDRILSEARETRAGKYFFSYSGTLTETYYSQIRSACEFAGVLYGRNVEGGFIPYDLRHTATTLLMHSGADLETISSVTGQSQHSLWHYTHASRESISRAAGILENFGDSLLGNGHNLDTKLISDSPILMG